MEILEAVITERRKVSVAPQDLLTAFNGCGDITPPEAYQAFKWKLLEQTFGLKHASYLDDGKWKYTEERHGGGHCRDITRVEREATKDEILLWTWVTAANKEMLLQISKKVID